ncbi:NrfD/PsrC family molybdoenzyme membrane anchor subunit [uncultured Jatrophihabitans sp.]|uniref:NrfD/PsrC family molybdoenzyme membrane anchor subunit n=1 Tax=uncultured Jatrophihabitans sp. TaxID=1610747 RepID=UPI0035CC60DB
MTETKPRRRRRGRGGGGGDGAPVVPDVEFTSYYGRPVLKASPWQDDIPAYLFLGGVAAGSSLLAAGADLTGRPALRRSGRIAALVAITGSFLALVHDLGRPERFVNMLRVAKPTSPMSVGTWILTVYGPMAGAAGASELAFLAPRFLRPLLCWLGRPAGLVAALTGPAVASYTAVLLSDTATPAWHEAHRELPFVFVGSAAAASGGLGMIAAPTAQAGPARRLAVLGAVGELVAEQRMEASMGMVAETLHTGRPGTLMKASKTLTVVGATLTAVAGRRSRAVSLLAGTSILAGSACTRFGVFEAGQESARDPKYTIVPQRARLDLRAQ